MTPRYNTALHGYTIKDILWQCGISMIRRLQLTRTNIFTVIVYFPSQLINLDAALKPIEKEYVEFHLSPFPEC